jgi:eukaryotic-like serine/threonine-protein kinase
MGLQPDDVLDGKYRILRLLGEGGMGAVYEGINTRIQRRVAIKVLHGTVKNNADAVQRFEREAQAAGRIGSKHIVQVLDLGDLPGGDRYMVMEYLDGTDLTTRIRTHGQMSPRELYPLAVQVLEGLIAAHEAGIVHRDLKPDNIFIVPEGDYSDFIKILDFGISKFSATGGEFSMTQTGMVMGTPYYMSPEQAKGSRDLDHRTDIYSFGVILYEALAGQVPYNAETFNALIIKIVLEDPPPLAAPKSETDAAFYAIVQKAMARNRAERYQTAAELQGELHDWARTFDIPLSNIVKRRSNFPPGTTRMHGTQRAWTQTTGSTAATERAPKAGLSPPVLVAATLGAAALALGVVYWLTQGPSGSPPQSPAPAATPLPAATSPATVSPVATSPAVPSPAQAAPDPTPPPARASEGSAPNAAPGPSQPTPEPALKPQAPSRPAKPPQGATTKPSETKTIVKSPEAKPKSVAPSSTTSAGRTIRTEL